MSEERLDRMENMLSQLISAVGVVMEEQSHMRDEQKAMREDQTAMWREIKSLREGQKSMQENQTAMWNEIKAMRKESDKRHKEIMGKLRTLEANQDHVWEKASHNEREFIKFKNQF